MGDPERVNRAPHEDAIANDPERGLDVYVRESSVQVKVARRSVPPPPPPTRASSVPPPSSPPPFRGAIPPRLSVSPRASVPPPPAPLGVSLAPSAGSAALACVRVARSGDVVAAQGPVDQLTQLVSYVGRLTTLISSELDLDPFHALCAELMGLRVVVFEDGGDLVGLLLQPGPEAQALRQRLGV